MKCFTEDIDIKGIDKLIVDLDVLKEEGKVLDINSCLKEVYNKEYAQSDEVRIVNVHRLVDEEFVKLVFEVVNICGIVKINYSNYEIEDMHKDSQIYTKSFPEFSKEFRSRLRNDTNSANIEEFDETVKHKLKAIKQYLMTQAIAFSLSESKGLTNSEGKEKDASIILKAEECSKDIDIKYKFKIVVKTKDKFKIEISYIDYKELHETGL